MKRDSVISRRAMLASAMAPAVRAAAPQRPNLVFLYSDDQAAWTLRHTGNPQARTPHIDSICRDGVTFANSFVTTPVCSPARASLMTSRYALETGIEDYLEPGANAEDGLDPKLPTWPQALREAGYRTGLIGKWHLGYKPQFHPTRFGYETFIGMIGGGSGPMDPELEVEGVTRKFHGPTPDVYTGHALNFIRGHRNQPFALSLHYREPHASNAPGIGPNRTWLPIPDADWAPFRDLDPAIPNPDYDQLDTAQVKRMMREYLASVAILDRNVGRVLSLLNELNLARNTIVVFTSDNGMNMGHNGIWHKGNGRWILKNKTGNRPNLNDNSLRVPAALRFPSAVAPGKTIRHTISNLDWFPTILSLTGTPTPSGAVLRGRDLSPLLKGRDVPWDQNLYAEYNMRHSMRADLRAFRTPQWKLVRDLTRPENEEFYDLARDPAESANLIRSSDPAVRKAYADLSAQLETKLRA